ncbi:DUF1853 family protein [Aquitalea denitrificans]|uniref:DUF1853 family protein n=1 Tax=Aquitalea denitrificans TaxID=519081 RepID=UPI00135B8E79|nr:DUF1853 family protein [Aquitalea denitrificans]
MSTTASPERSFYLPFTQPALRDLAFLLTAPAPWDSGSNLSPQRLLGRDGPALLAALEHDPAPLNAWLAAQPCRRLGHYAERLLAFWFHLAPHIELVAANLPVSDAGGRTVGEFDFLVRLDGEPLHVETASKFYLQLGRGPDTLIGPSLRDAWLLKAAKLQAQLRLVHHPAARRVLPAGFADCASQARLAGWFFYSQMLAPQPPLAADQLQGWISPVWQDWPSCSPASRWIWLPRLQWLAPARVRDDTVREQHSLRQELLQAAVPQLVAELLPVGDGYWEEVARGFVVPSGWPEQAALQQLLASMAGCSLG